MSQQLTPARAQSLFDALKRLKAANTSVRFNWVNARRKSGVVEVSTQDVSIYWHSSSISKSIVVKLGAFELVLLMSRPGSVPAATDDIVIRFVVEGTTCRFIFQDIKGDREQTLQFS